MAVRTFWNKGKMIAQKKKVLQQQEKSKYFKNKLTKK
jgi:hypothetical protein